MSKCCIIGLGYIGLPIALSFAKKNIKIDLHIVPETMIRIQNDKLESFRKVKLIREITIFTHDSYWDLLACLSGVINFRNDFYKKTGAEIDSLNAWKIVRMDKQSINKFLNS